MTPQDVNTDASATTNGQKRKRPGPAKTKPKAAALNLESLSEALMPRLLSELQAIPKVTPTPLIFSAINKIMEEIAPIAKEHRHEDQDFWFRKIDEMMDTLQPLLTAHRVITVPEVLEHNCRENPVLLASGERYVQFFTTVKVRWHLYCAIDGSEFPSPCVTMGEGMSELHFSTNAAQTMAYKQMLVQVFFIPVAGQDPEEITGSRSQQSAPVYQTPESTAAPGPAQTGSLFDNDDDFTPPDAEPETKRKRTKKEPQTAVAGVQQSLANTAPAQGGPISSGFVSIIRSTLAAKGVKETDLLAHLQTKTVESIRTDQMDSAMSFINSGGAQ